MPPTLKFLKRAMSHCWSPGLRRILRPAFPNVPGVGAANAAGLNQKFWSLPSESRLLVFASGSPTRL